MRWRMGPAFGCGGRGRSSTRRPPGRGQMHRLPDQDPRVPEGIQRPCVRWTVHRTNYHGQIRAHRHRPARGASVLQFSHSALGWWWEGSGHPLASSALVLPSPGRSGRQPTLKELSNDGGRRRPPPGSSSVCGRRGGRTRRKVEILNSCLQAWHSSMVKYGEGMGRIFEGEERRGDYMST